MSENIIPLATEATVHGVFMEVFDLGVLLTGESGIGKSELALGLIDKGHRLIADDAVNFIRQNNRLLGCCPSSLQHFLEVHGLGILNIQKIFGEAAVAEEHFLDLVIHITDYTLKDLQTINRLQGMVDTYQLLEISVPSATIPVTAGRNLAVLVEAAAHNQRLKLRGYDAALDFKQRHAQLLNHGNEITHY